MRYAIARGELLLHYQPQLNISDGSIIGFEALLRWQSPEHGFIMPQRFISLAEQNGLIQNIGQWVLQEACQFVQRLISKGWINIRVSVNVSPCQLCSDEFIDSVHAVLANSEVQPHQLELEIIENFMATSLDEATRQLNKLHALGVGLALDDFGTGWKLLLI